LAAYGYRKMTRDNYGNYAKNMLPHFASVVLCFILIRLDIRPAMNRRFDKKLCNGLNFC
jgi:hypothetical protein